MKTFIILSLLSFSFAGFAQKIAPAKPITEWEPMVYLDSVNVELSHLYFDVKKIGNIQVVSDYYDSARQIHGKIFIQSKDPTDFHFLPIGSITGLYKKDAQTPAIFMLDNEFLKDTSSYKIDSSYILNVELTSTNEMNYLKNAMPGLTIVKIITKTKENLDKQNQIRIRGTQSTVLK
jgi:hypothetical protein